MARDNTVHLGPRWLQLPPGPRGRSHAGRRLELRECLDGRLVALDAGRLLAAQPSPGPEFVLRPRSDPTAERRQRLRVPRSSSEEGGRYLPLPSNGASSTARRAPARPRRAAALTLRIRGAADSTPSALTQASPQGGDIFTEQLA